MHLRSSPLALAIALAALAPAAPAQIVLPGTQPGDIVNWWFWESQAYCLFCHSTIPAEAIACSAAFSLRACAIIFDIRTGPPGEFIRIGRYQSDANTKGTNDGSRT